MANAMTAPTANTMYQYLASKTSKAIRMPRTMR